MEQKMALKKFKEAFGEGNVKFIKDTGGTVSEDLKLINLKFRPGWCPLREILRRD